jgi:ribosome recycling factor
MLFHVRKFASKVAKEQFLVAPYTARMVSHLASLRKEVDLLRSERQNSNALESILVSDAEKVAKLSQLALVSVKDAKTLVVHVHAESLVKPVEKAIKLANKGFEIQNIGQTTLHVTLQRMTDELRAARSKSLLSLAEKTKSNIRQQRQEARNDLKKLKLHQDANALSEKDIQKVTDEHVKMVDTLVVDKQKDWNKA